MQVYILRVNSGTIESIKVTHQKKEGEKVIKSAIYDFKIVGKLKISYNDTAITYIEFLKDDENSGKSVTSELSDKAYKQLSEYFDGKRKEFDLPLDMQGTAFQKQVWEALTKIPYGQTRSYKDIAQAIKNPKAVRAVGNANNKNPISIIVPCHRVIGSDGKLVGYASGLKIKEQLLKLESK